MFYDRFLELCNDKGVKPSRVATDTGFNKGSVSVWKKKYENGEDTQPTSEILSKIANYFNVSVDYLLEKTDIKSPQGEKINDDDLKFALFGEVADKIPDSKLNEVKNFADYIKNDFMKNQNNK